MKETQLCMYAFVEPPRLVRDFGRAEAPKQEHVGNQTPCHSLCKAKQTFRNPKCWLVGVLRTLPLCNLRNPEPEILNQKPQTLDTLNPRP